MPFVRKQRVCNANRVGFARLADMYIGTGWDEKNVMEKGPVPDLVEEVRNCC
jgi:hypothetical protein